MDKLMYCPMCKGGTHKIMSSDGSVRKCVKCNGTGTVPIKKKPIDKQKS